jgi:hypothetical protein
MELPGHRNSRSTNLYTIDGVSASLNATFLNKASGLAVRDSDFTCLTCLDLPTDLPAYLRD